MWGKVYCVRKQHDGRDWASNRTPSCFINPPYCMRDYLFASVFNKCLLG